MFTVTSFSQNLLSKEHTKPSRAEMVENLRVYIEDEMIRNKITGLSIAVVDADGVLLSDGFGKADRENNIEANSSTLFPIASVTKTFTGIAVMQLVEKGLVDPDRPISYYIPELSLPENEEKIITVGMLLTHHSGIHGDILYNWYLPEVSDDPLIYEQVVDLINRLGTISPPGKLHSYSNAGYSLLGVLIHRVSGMGYADYIRSNIFEPLGMKSSIVFAGEKTKCVVSKGYNGKKSTSMPMKLGIPAGGIAMTADDAAKYINGIIEAYHGKRPVLRSETMRMMMTQQNKNVIPDDGFSIGLTWFLQDPVMEHTLYAAHRGEMPPYHSMLIILPEVKLGVFIGVNTNSAAHIPEEMAHKIIYNLYEYQTGISVDKKGTTEKKSSDFAQLKKFEGIYPNVYFGPMELKIRSEKLLLKSPFMPVSMVLVPQAGSTFLVRARFMGITFQPKQLSTFRIDFRESGGDKFMRFHIDDRMLNTNLKIEPFKLPIEYQHYTGKYKVVNMENSGRVVKDVRLKMDRNGKMLLFQYTFLGRHKFNMVVQPTDSRKAKFAGAGYFTGDKIRWEKTNKTTYMFWSGLKLQKMK